MQIRNKTLLSRTMQKDHMDIVNCMIDLEDETQAVFTESFDLSNIKLTRFLDYVVCFEIEVSVCAQRFDLSIWTSRPMSRESSKFLFKLQKRHAELVAAVEEKYVDFVSLTAEIESNDEKPFEGQIYRQGGKMCIKIFGYENFSRLNTTHSYFLHCLSNRFPFQVTKLCQRMCARDKLIPLLLYNPRFYKREKLEAFTDNKPLV